MYVFDNVKKNTPFGVEFKGYEDCVFRSMPLGVRILFTLCDAFPLSGMFQMQVM
jgi:hypothetical protein